MSEIIDFLSDHPIYGIDNSSLEQWKKDCEDEWDCLTKIGSLFPNKKLFHIIINAYCDLAVKTSPIIYSSMVWSMEDRKKSNNSSSSYFKRSLYYSK